MGYELYVLYFCSVIIYSASILYSPGELLATSRDLEQMLVQPTPPFLPVSVIHSSMST